LTHQNEDLALIRDSLPAETWDMYLASKSYAEIAEDINLKYVGHSYCLLATGTVSF